MACDPHPRTPHAFLWLGINREGEMVIPFSWWPQTYVRAGSHATVKHYVEGIKEVEKYLGCKVYNRVMDSAGKGMNADEERSYFDAYQEAGIYFRPAKKNRDLSGFDLITDALRPISFVVGNEQKTKPRLTIMQENDELVWQMSHLRFAEWRGNVVDKDPPEKAQEKPATWLTALLTSCLISRDSLTGDPDGAHGGRSTLKSAIENGKSQLRLPWVAWLHSLTSTRSLRAQWHVVEPDQINILTPSVLCDLEQV